MQKKRFTLKRHTIVERQRCDDEVYFAEFEVSIHN